MLLRLFLIFIFFVTSSNAVELKEVSAEVYKKESPSEERELLINFLVDQFKDKKVSIAQLNKLWSNKLLREKYMMARFQIINQQVYAESYYLGHYYFPVLLQYFQRLVKTYKIPDVDFIIYMREEIPMSETLGKHTMGIPAFIMFQDLDSEYETDKLLFPDGYFLKNNKNSNWGELLNRIKKAGNKHPWEKKIDKVFWRGNTTGDFHIYTVDNFSKLPRLTISILSKLYPDLIDAQFSYYSPQIMYENHGKNLREFCEILFGPKPKSVNEVDHLKYKYLLSLDGNAATGTRVTWIMYSNSVLLKQESRKIQWYYSALKAYKNYVPVNHRLTDIFDQIQWMQTHDKELKEIAKNAHNFAASNMMPNHIDSHVVILLNEYAKIQQDKEIKPSLTPADEVISLGSVLRMLGYRFKKYLQDRAETWF